ncbi:MAG: hypothetical protein DRZ79_04530 [Candidatus Cloacimonadota bacterium]|nr:MAG: hypothetical protein DRZ79_04530 [Candidatus Cloacimonadota bacterium]
MKRIILILVLVFPLLCLSYDFDKGGLRNAAMGGTGISSSDDAAAAVWNPALLDKINHFVFITDSRPYLIQLDNDNIYQNFTYFGIPTGKFGTFALTGGLFNSNGYDEGKFGFHYGKTLLAKKIAVGFGINDFYTNFTEINNTKNAVDADIGFYFSPSEIVNIGFIINNLSRANLASEEGIEDKLPRIIGLGTSLNLKRLNFSGDFQYEQTSAKDNIRIGLGTEFSLMNYFKLRAGINNDNYTAGFGLDVFSKKWFDNSLEPKENEPFDIKFFNVSMDYAFEYPLNFSLDKGNLHFGNEIESPYGDHFVGIKIEFGKSKIAKDELINYFPALFGAKTDTVFITVEKTKIDTVYEEKTVYDTITIIKRIVDPNLVAQAVHESQATIKKETSENVNAAAKHLTNALKLYYEQNYEGAISECKKAIRIAPNFALSYLRLGSIYYKLGDAEEALYYWEKAKKLDPENEEIKQIFEDIKRGKFDVKY